MASFACSQASATRQACPAAYNRASSEGGAQSIGARAMAPSAICFRYPDCLRAAPIASRRLAGSSSVQSVQSRRAAAPPRALASGEDRSQPGQTRLSASFSDAPLSAQDTSSSNASESQTPEQTLSPAAMERMRRVRSERATYLVAAMVSSVGFTCLAAAAVIYRFASQLQDGGDVPMLEVFGTFALAVGAAVGMEFWARWAHKALWHGSLWNMHESHHKPREGPFELNDIFAIINAGPAIGLLAYGFFFPGLVPAVCFGAGLGITMFGMAYMFVHDGLVHRRFPVGPVADVPYLQKVAAAHQLHHADKFEGVPYGLFLGPQELADVGGEADLQELLASRRAARATASQQR